MTKAGYDIGGCKSQTVIQYVIPDAAEVNGTDTQCYDAEFSDVDSMWQVANEDTSETATILRECLVKAGLTPRSTKRT